MKKVLHLLPNHRAHCLLIKQAFSPDFCDQLINSKKNSFKKASTHYPTSYRNNERQVLDNEEFAQQLFQKIKNYIPDIIETEGMSKQESGTWKLNSLNTRIRICRYLPNQYFNKHLDGVHYVSAEQQSKLTFMIYLNGNEDFEGGRTLFFESKESDSILSSYEPEKGDLIIFDHNLWHSGETVLKGEKYILRSDIIYQKIDANPQVNNSFCGEGHLGYIWTATLHDNKLITSGRDKKIKIWSKDGEKLSELTGHKNSIISLIGFDDDTIVSASRDMSIKIWRRKVESEFGLVTSLNFHKGAVLSLCKMDTKSFLSGGADGRVNQIDIDGNLIDQYQAHEEWIWDIVKIDDEKYASISEDGSLKIWKYDTHRLVTAWQENIPVNSIAVEPSMILIGRFDGSIIRLIFDYQTKTLKEISRKKCHNGIIRRIMIDEQYLYSASEDSTLKIWDKVQLEFVKLFKHRNFVQDIVLLNDSIISVSYDGEIIKHNRPISEKRGCDQV